MQETTNTTMSQETPNTADQSAGSAASCPGGGKTPKASEPKCACETMQALIKEFLEKVKATLPGASMIVSIRKHDPDGTCQKSDYEGDCLLAEAMAGDLAERLRSARKNKGGGISGLLSIIGASAKD